MKLFYLPGNGGIPPDSHLVVGVSSYSNVGQVNNRKDRENSMNTSYGVFSELLTLLASCFVVITTFPV